jgi:hypothetical protein
MFRFLFILEIGCVSSPNTICGNANIRKYSSNTRTLPKMAEEKGDLGDIKHE